MGAGGPQTSFHIAESSRRNAPCSVHQRWRAVHPGALLCSCSEVSQRLALSSEDVYDELKVKTSHLSQLFLCLLSLQGRTTRAISLWHLFLHGVMNIASGQPDNCCSTNNYCWTPTGGGKLIPHILPQNTTRSETCLGSEVCLIKPQSCWRFAGVIFHLIVKSGLEPSSCLINLAIIH